MLPGKGHPKINAVSQSLAVWGMLKVKFSEKKKRVSFSLIVDGLYPLVST